jgi:flagellin
MAQTASRHLGKSYEHLSTSVERLSSGLRINSAKDDAAGLAVRELIRADVAALQQGSRNASDGVSMLQAAEGALGEIDAILIRMRELAEQAATGTYSSTQKSIMQNEYDELTKEITRIATTTDFNDINLLQGTGSVEITLGAGVQTNQTIKVDQKALTATDLQLDKTASSAGTAEVVFFNNATGGNWITGAGTDAVAFDLETAGVGGADTEGTIYLTFDGISNSAKFDSNGLAAGDLVTIHTGLTFETGPNGGFRLTGSSSGNVTDLEWSVAIGTGATAHWGDETSGVGTIATTTDAVTLEVTSATVTEGVASTATANVYLTNGTVAQSVIDEAIETKDSYRAKLGYWMNRLEYAASVLDVQAENLMAAESRISDVDVATEMSRMTRNQVLAQAGISMLAQANSMPQMALSLLQ